MSEHPAEPAGTERVRVGTGQVAAFAQASGDHNPLHTDGGYARSTPFGEPLAHGALGALAALAGIPDREGERLVRVEARFPGPLVPGRSYRRTLAERDAREGEDTGAGESGERLVLVTLLDGERPVLTVEAVLATGPAPADAPTTGGGVHPRATPADPGLGELRPGGGGAHEYAPDWAESGRLLRELGVRHRGVTARHAAALAWASYLAGMEYPGRSSLLLRFAATFPRGGADAALSGDVPLAARAEVTTLNPGFRTVTVHGELSAPGGGATVAEVELHVHSRRGAEPTAPDRLAALLAPSGRLTGRVALVVGGSRGLGAALVQALAQQGATVYLAYQRSDEEAEAVRDGLGTLAGRVVPVRGDAGDPDWCRELRERIVTAHGRCDLLVLNACPPLHDMDLAADDGLRLLEFVHQSLALVQVPLAAFARELAGSGGRVLALSSSALDDPPPDWPHYVTAKAATEGLLRALVAQLPTVGGVLARPPRLRTTLTHSMRADDEALPVEDAAVTLVETLLAGTTPGRVETLSDFPHRRPPRPEGRGAEPEVADRGSLVVAATFTAEPIAPALEFWLTHLGLDLDVEFAPYGQVFQELLVPGSAFATNPRGCDVVLLRLEDWPEDESQRTVREFTDAVRGFAPRAAVPLLVVLAPASPGNSGTSGRASELAAAERTLRADLADVPGAHVVDWRHFGDQYRVPGHHDPERERLGHIPYTPLAFTALGTVTARAVRALAQPPAKVLVLDCDNTLWSGVCGEDGTRGVTVEEGRLRLQRWALGLRDRGVLLCLCSKNEEADVLAVLRRADLPIGAEHLAAHRVNWLPKSENLASLAAELGLGLDAFVFLDDNPLETAEVSAAHPQVLALTLPADASGAAAAVEHLWAFDQLEVTDEDRQRAETYRASQRRESVRQSAMSYADFIDGLGLRVDIAPAAPGQHARISQLSYRTNQFNTTTLRRSEAEVRALGEDPPGCWVAEVSDRFGAYGLVGVATAKPSGRSLVVDSLMMSCRVLGRGVEHALLAHVAGEAVRAGLDTVELPFRPTERNAPARRFLEEVAAGNAAEAVEDATGTVFRLPAAHAAAVTFSPAAHHEPPETPGTPTHSAAPAGARSSALWTIPEELSDLAEVLRRAERETAGDAAPDRSPGRGDGRNDGDDRPAGGQEEVARALREVFHQVLRVPAGRLGPEVTLEELDLTSFTIVDLTARLESRFGRLPQTLLFEHRTLGEVAEAIAGHRTRRAPDAPDAPEVAQDVRPDRSTRPEVPERPVAPASTRPATPTAGPAGDEAPPAPGEPVAIVGMAGRYPDAPTLEDLAGNLARGHDSVREVDAGRWRGAAPPDDGTRRWACLLDEPDRFDSLFFQISPREAELMDPQQRLFLEVAYETLQDAGLTRASLGPDVGVYVGAMAQDYAVLGAGTALRGDRSLPYAANYQIANRVSYFLDLSGPSLVVDTACSSSGVALHLACEDLRNGRVSAALVGGVNLILHPSRHLQYAQMGMLSPTGRCAAFGAAADGMVMGEGAGAVLLKPLSRALRDGDHVHAVIRGTATNSGGRTSGFTVPNPDAQAALVRDALRSAGVEPDSVTLIEAHGTGTPLGDPIEFRGLGRVFGSRAPGRAPLALGSVKGNIGHLEPAAAIAGLTRVVLQMRRRTLLPSLGAGQLNPALDVEGTPFFVPGDPAPWEADGPRRAGVSSFGAGGVNAHVVVEEFTHDRDGEPGPAPEPGGGRELVVLSARTGDRLARVARRLRTWLSDGADRPALRDVAHTLRVGREALETRVAFPVTGLDELLDALDALAEHGPDAPHGARSGRAHGASALNGVFDGGAAATAFLAELASRGEWEKLAELWARGAQIDWSRVLPPVAGAHRVPLPPYPFEPVRHWLPTAEAPSTGTTAAPPPAPASAVAEADAPLPGERSWDAGRAELGWDGSEPYLRDHVIGGRPLLPGVLYLELALRAARRHGVPGATRISGMVWSRPIAVAGDPFLAELTARPADEGAEILFRERDGARLARCVVRADPVPSAEPPPLPDPEDGDWDGHLTADAVYRSLRDRAMDYGPGLRSVNALWRRTREALADVEVPAAPGWETERFVLHPALLDGALQATVVGSGLPGAYLPYAVSELTVHRAPVGRCRAHVTFTRCDAEMIRCDVRVADVGGRTALTLRDLVLLPPSPAGGDASRATEAPAPQLWAPAWRERRLTGPAAAPAPDTLVLTGDPRRGAEWREAAGSGRVRVARLTVAERLDAARLVAEPPAGDGESTGARAPLLVVDYGPWENAGDTAARLGTAHELGRAAVHQGRPVTYLCLTPPAADEPLAVAVGAFGLSVGRESGDFRCTRVEVPHDTPPTPGHLVAESGSGAAEVRGVGAGREVRGFTPDPRPVTERSPFRAGGTYIVSGGAGGVGRALTRHLTTSHGATVVALGRSAPPPEEEAPGAGRAVHLRVDVTDPEATRRAVAEVRHRFGRVHGVFHAAGVLADALVSEKRLSDCERVLAPKVGGAASLDAATADDDLDLFVLMSSTSGTLGNAGQSDYAMANRFLDAFAEQRAARVAAGTRAGRSLSMVWPLWRDGGMRPDDQVVRLTATTTGFTPLSTPAALSALETALRTRETVVLVGEGDRDRVARTLEALTGSGGADPAPGGPAGAAPERSADRPPAAGDLAPALNAALCRIAAGLLKVSLSDVEPDVEFGDVGFDSVLFTEFANLINDEFGLDLAPVVFFDNPTVAELAGVLLRDHGPALATALAPAAEPAPDLPASPPASHGETPAPPEPGAGPVPERPEPSAEPFPADAAASPSSEPIAIVGAACRFPGAENLDAYWDNLVTGRDLVSDAPEDRWDRGETARRGGFVDGVHAFDAAFFRVTPREALTMDPQQRLFLEAGWTALEHAGYDPRRMAGQRAGVFAGASLHDHLDVLGGSGSEVTGLTATGNVHSVLPNRLSHLLDLRGPSEAVDTACSSSLAAVHRAVLALRGGECGTALAGGTNVLLSPTWYESFERAGMLSRAGRCATFDRDADGYVRGEGVGVVVLKRLSDALRDGDTVHALIRGTAVGHGGRGHSLTAPNAAAQADVIAAAYETARVSPWSVSFVETHGTGTELGDPIEVEGLASAFGRFAPDGVPEPRCGLGAVKTAIGHLESASGVAGLLKVVLALRHRTLPPNLHFSGLNPYVRLDGTPFYVVDEARDWTPPLDGEGRPLPRRAGLSAFGFGGSNAHVVIEEPPRAERAPAPSGPQLLVLSAADEAALDRYARRLRDALGDLDPGVPLADVAHTLRVGRPELPQRLALVAGAPAEAATALTAFLAGEESPPLRTGRLAGRRASQELTVEDGADRARLLDLAGRWVTDGTLVTAGTAGGQRRVPLPTYPFERHIHRVPSPFVTGAPVSPPAGVAGEERAPGPRTRLLRRVWRPSAAGPAPREADPGEVWLALAGAGQIPSVTSALGAVPGVTWVVVREPSKLPRLARHEYEVDFADGDAVARLTADLLRTHPRIDGLVNFSALDAASDDPAAGRTGPLAPRDTAALTLVRALATRRPGPRPVTLLWLVPRPDGPSGSPAASRTAALVRALGAEYGHVTARSVEIDPPADGTATALLETAGREIALLRSPAPGEPAVRYRDGQRAVPVLTDAVSGDLPTAPGRFGPFAVHPDRTYLITGGTGGLGLAVAERLVARGARGIALTGRRPLPPRESWDDVLREGHERAPVVAAIRRMERAGAHVRYHLGAPGDTGELAAFLDEARARGGPIAGLVHCAGVVPRAPEPFVRQELADVGRVWEPKGGGLLTLDRLLAGDGPDFVVLYSSVSATVPSLGAGVAAYAGANAFLDAFAEDAARHRPGTAYRSVAWGSWRGAGVGEVSAAAYRDAGLAGLDPEPGLDLLERALCGPDPVTLGLAVSEDFDAARLLAPAAPGTPPAPAQPGAEVPPGPAAEAATGETRDVLAGLLAEELLVSREALESGATFAELGVDSILIAGLVRHLERLTGRTVSPSVILEHDTLDALAAHLGPTAPAPRPAAPPAPSPTTPGVSGAPPAADGAVAIVGMAGRYPGAPTLADFWRLLSEGRSAVREVPVDRWDHERLYRPGHHPGYSVSKWGGFLEDVELFDPGYFDVAEAEAAHLDPLIRLFLETADATFRDAGIEREELAGTRTGVFVGAVSGDYGRRVTVPGPATATGLNQNFIAARLAQVYDLRGPHLVVDTACSSALTALHLGMRSLQAGESEMCLVGGVELLLDETPYLKLSASRALSPDGRCRAFDAGANGIVLGEGAGAVLIKPLAAALRDGDRVHAVVEATAVNNDGRTMGLTTPSPEAQRELVAGALATAGVSADTVSYVEAHGTGTMIGDPIELKALTTVFREFSEDRGYCAVGSVKSNIGHLLAAAGVAGLHKVALALANRRIPPTLFCDTPNPRFDFGSSPFFPCVSPRDWEPRHGTRRAGVSAFGFGGTNAHAVLRELTAEERAVWRPRRAALPPATMRRRRFWLERPTVAHRAPWPGPGAPAHDAAPAGRPGDGSGTARRALLALEEFVPEEGAP
ncbi:SDR family NAD(P)-dependent oxidoreductase [Streptomyces sp. AJS327]|uniref:SDR family NAD(P)-dependent oxidoreductase n=1 Tax=Streptomyces sp. AJS327 TaxID=2545265 RepID=UPI0015DFC590|nr:SDR family NAD(P)-dependent oxidoreductase [Streptomyces sp. AJS327]